MGAAALIALPEIERLAAHTNKDIAPRAAEVSGLIRKATGD